MNIREQALYHATHDYEKIAVLSDREGEKK